MQKEMLKTVIFFSIIIIFVLFICVYPSMTGSAIAISPSSQLKASNTISKVVEKSTFDKEALKQELEDYVDDVMDEKIDQANSYTDTQLVAHISAMHQNNNANNQNNPASRLSCEIVEVNNARETTGNRECGNVFIENKQSNCISAFKERVVYHYNENNCRGGIRETNFITNTYSCNSTIGLGTYTCTNTGVLSEGKSSRDVVVCCSIL